MKINTENEVQKPMPLGKKNYMLIAAAVLIIAIGYLLLQGGGSENPAEEFNYEMFSTRRIVVAPLVLLLGFVVGGVAIMKKFKK